MEDDDQKLNPGQTHADNQFKILNDAEKDGTINDSSDENGGDSHQSSVDKVKDSEENPWTNKFTGQTNTKSGALGKIGSPFKVQGLKKAAPALLIIILFAILAMLILLTQFGMPFQIKAALLTRYNSSLASRTARTDKIINSKIASSLTSGICAKISIRCKYSTMSKEQVEEYKKAGIEVVPDETYNNGDRIRPKELIFKEEHIKPPQFKATLASNSEFSLANRQAYNTKYAETSAKTFLEKVLGKLGMTKKATDLGDENATDEERLKIEQEAIKNPKPTLELLKSGDKKPDGTEYTDTTDEGKAELAEANKQLTAEYNKLLENAKAATSDGTKSSFESTFKENLSIAKDGLLLRTKSALTISSEFVGALSVPTILCIGRELIIEIGELAKTTRANQLARDGFGTLNVIDEAKAGDGKDYKMSYLGTRLATQTVSDDGQLKSATDSAGYKAAAYGDVLTMKTTSSRYINGGGLSGELSTVMDQIKKQFNNSADSACKVLLSAPVMIVSVLIGVGLKLVEASIAAAGLGSGFGVGVAVAIIAREVASFAAAAAAFSAFSALPALYNDVTAGVAIDSNTTGEELGDELTSAVSTGQTMIAQANANGPLTPEQQVKYQKSTVQVGAEYANEDRLAYSPFDVTNSNTFMGKVVGYLTPYASKMSSLSGIFYSVASIITKSFAIISPQAAKADTESTDLYTQCQDEKYKKMGLSTDMFCNVSYGMPGVEDGPDPVEIVDKLSNFVDPATKEVRPLISEDTGDPLDPQYKGFVNNCINRTKPLVESTNFKIASGSKDDIGPTGRLPTESKEPGATECMYNETLDTTPITRSYDWCGTQPTPTSPGNGLVYISANAPYSIGTCADGSAKMRRDYFYISNGLLYMHYLDQIINAEIDDTGVSARSPTSSSQFISLLSNSIRDSSGILSYDRVTI
jgi:hypothetical protein